MTFGSRTLSNANFWHRYQRVSTFIQHTSFFAYFFFFFEPGWRADCERHHEETINTVKATANEQIPFNVQGVCFFLRVSERLVRKLTRLSAVSGWVQQSLSDRGSHASWRSWENQGRKTCTSTVRATTIWSCNSLILLLFSEIGDLLCMKSKYGPGGEYEPDWWAFFLSTVFNRNLPVLGNRLVLLVLHQLTSLHPRRKCQISLLPSNLLGEPFIHVPKRKRRQNNHSNSSNNQLLLCL